MQARSQGDVGVCRVDGVWGLGLEGRGGLVSRFIMGITGVTIWVIGIINLFTVLSLPAPPSTPAPAHPTSCCSPMQGLGFALLDSGGGGNCYWAT